MTSTELPADSPAEESLLPVDAAAEQILAEVPAGPPPSPTLGEALAKQSISLPDDQVAKLDQYVRLLWDWNEKINLTRHTDYDKFVTRDLVDTLELSKFLHPGEEILDVGTGGGVPGLVLAIIRPDLKVHLCDSVQKKAKVVSEIAEALKLEVDVFGDRAENQLKDYRYDALVSRAVGPMSKMLEWFKPHWASIGRLLLVKGPKWVEERGEARHKGLMANLELRKAAEYLTPGTEWNSVIIKLWHKGGVEK